MNGIKVGFYRKMVGFSKEAAFILILYSDAIQTTNRITEKMK